MAERQAPNVGLIHMLILSRSVEAIDSSAYRRLHWKAVPVPGIVNSRITDQSLDRHFEPQICLSIPSAQVKGQFIVCSLEY